MRSRKILNISARLGLLVLTAMAVGQNQTPANVPPPATWKDPNSRLMWALKDNGSDITQRQALDYCRNFGLAEFKDWRLPEIDELAGLYDPSVAQQPSGKDYDVHVKGGIQLTTGAVWSATQKNSGAAWVIYFGLGNRYSVGVGHSDLRRALCVRRVGE